MNLLLLSLLAVVVLGLRSGSRRPDVRWAAPMLIACGMVAFAYLSQRFL
jgi:hypothetical protein